LGAGQVTRIEVSLARLAETESGRKGTRVRLPEVVKSLLPPALLALTLNLYEEPLVRGPIVVEVPVYVANNEKLPPSWLISRR
jgi:hypothetical protein